MLTLLQETVTLEVVTVEVSIASSKVKVNVPDETELPVLLKALPPASLRLEMVGAVASEVLLLPSSVVSSSVVSSAVVVDVVDPPQPETETRKIKMKNRDL